MLGGLDWTNTFLGRAFKAQEQVLFFFAAIIFIISVVLHLFSIQERSYSAHQQEPSEPEEADSASSFQLTEILPRIHQVPELELIIEEDPFEAYEDNQSETEVQKDFLNVMRSKSDSVLAVPDTTIELDPDLDLDDHFLHNLEPALFQDFSSGMPFEYCLNSSCQANQCSNLPVEATPTRDDEHPDATKVTNGDLAGDGKPKCDMNHLNKSGVRHSHATVRCQHPSFYRQPSFTFSYYGRVRFHRPRRLISPAPIKSSRSLNDIDRIPRLHEHRRLKKRGSASSGTDEDDSDSEEAGGSGTTVKLLWLSMLKMPPQLWRLCVCHLVTWFSIISQAVFYTDFMGQVIYEGNPKVRGGVDFLLSIFISLDSDLQSLQSTETHSFLHSGCCKLH